MKKTICLVQPVQSPYWTERLKELSKNNELEIILLLERADFEHRPGWQPEPICGVRTIVLGSYVNAVQVKHKDLGYQVDGVRTVPWRLSQVLMELKPDVIVVCNATQVLCALPARARLGFHLALIVEDTPHATRNLPFLKLVVKKWLYRRANSWLPYSGDAEEFLKNIGIRQNLYRSSWSIDTNCFKPLPSLGREDGKYTISVIASMIQQKGILELVKEWSSIPEKSRERFELKIAGSGPLREVIEDYLLSNNVRNVRLLGQIPYSEVVSLLQHSSLFVLPTLQDLCSLTVPEAMACGCPVITTPYNGARDLIDHGVSGWIVDPLQPGELALCLTNAISDIERLQNMGQLARQRALSRDNKKVMHQFSSQLIEMWKS